VAGAAATIGVVACPTVNVIGKLCVPAGQLKSIEPLYTPGFKPVELTFTTGLAGVTPPVGLMLSHLPPLLVVTVVLQGNEAEQPCETPKLITFPVGDGCKYALAKVNPPGEIWIEH